MSQHDSAYWHARAAALAFNGQAYIDGAYCNAADGATFPASSPIDGRKLADVAACGQADVNRAVAAARRAFEAGVWSQLAPRERKARLLRLAALIDQHTEELALLETLDMGKPIRDALAFDVPETARCYAWYAEAIDKIYDEIAPTGPDALATITREPLGVVAAVARARASNQRLRRHAAWRDIDVTALRIIGSGMVLLRSSDGRGPPGGAARVQQVRAPGRGRQQQGADKDLAVGQVVITLSCIPGSIREPAQGSAVKTGPAAYPPKQPRERTWVQWWAPFPTTVPRT